MPVAEAIAGKAKEIQAYDALCATNVAASQRLETEFAQVQKELAKQQGFLTLCLTQLKATTAEIPKLEKIIKDKGTKPADKARAEAALKAAHIKLKSLKEQDPHLKKVVQQLDGEAKAHIAAKTHKAVEAKSLATRKTELAAEMAALQAKLKQAQVIDAYTLDMILGNPGMLRDFGRLTHTEETCAFILNGPKGNKSTYDKFVKTDDINLNGSGDVSARFQKLAAVEKGGTAVDWTKAPWADAHAHVVRQFKNEKTSLPTYKSRLKAERGLA